MEKIHHTRGVYPNDDWKDNGVLAKDLASHIDYNKTFRPGRALFVDGECVHEGGLGAEQIERHKQLIARDKKNGMLPTKRTAPYR